MELWEETSPSIYFLTESELKDVEMRGSLQVFFFHQKAKNTNLLQGRDEQSLKTGGKQTDFTLQRKIHLRTPLRLTKKVQNEQLVENLFLLYWFFFFIKRGEITKKYLTSK